MSFEFERLDAYRAAIEFARGTDGIVRRIGRRQPTLADQLSRAAVSIVLNTAEGAGEFSGPEKARFFRIARRSATEAAAALALVREVGLLEPALLTPMAEMADRIGAMLTRLILQWERAPRPARPRRCIAPDREVPRDPS